MEPLLDRMRRGDLLVGDGAIGTMLMAAGLPTGDAPERWTLERPDVVAAVAAEYVEAGADLITTNTFGGSPLRLRSHGLAARTTDVNARGAAIARRAAADRAHVAGSVGPTGLLLKPLGPADPFDVLDGFRRQIAALASGGADLVCVETMTDLTEASLALEAARAEAPGLPVVVTLTFELTPRGPYTIMGVDVKTACTRLQAEGASAIGANCGSGPHAMRHVAEEFARRSALPLIFQPNAGLPQQVGSQLVYPQAPESFAAEAILLASFAVIVGGCCGTTPAHIRHLRLKVNEQILRSEP